MSEMPHTATPLQRFSAGEISRRELGNLLGQPISFGDMLMQLHEHNLPLPQYGLTYNPTGVELIKKWAERNCDG